MPIFHYILQSECDLAFLFHRQRQIAHPSEGVKSS